MLQHLEWRSLQDRRKDSRLNMFYKIVYNKVEIQKTDRLIPQKRQTRHSHTKSFQIPSCKTEYRKESFFPRTITDGNKLLENIINSTSLDSFKSSISKLQYWFSIIYLYYVIFTFLLFLPLIVHIINIFGF